MKTLRPVNQKSIYHSYADLYEKIMNDEIKVDKAEVAAHCLDGMNRTSALELKRAEIEHMLKGSSMRVEIRTVEIKNFDNTPLEEGNNEQQ